MGVDPVLIFGSAVVGFLVGTTGAGGGALMTPMLILLFGVKPSAAISSDLVAAVFMRPVGAAVHLRKGTVHLEMVGWLALGAVPAAFAGAALLGALGAGKGTETDVEIALGVALVLGAAAMAGRGLWRQRRGEPQERTLSKLPVSRVPTVAVGVLGGLMVGATSVGSGSLMIVLLLCVYPTITASQLVGTDLVQAVPLTAAAALGQLVFGHVELAVTASIIIGSVPGVLFGALLSSRAQDRYVRPIITVVIFASGLKYLGLDPAGVAGATGAAVAGAVAWSLVNRWEPRRREAAKARVVAMPSRFVAWAGRRWSSEA